MRGHTVAFGFITAALGLSVLIHWAVLKNTRIYFSEKQGSRLPELVFWGSILNRNQLIDARPEHSASTTAPAWFDVETPPPENHVLSRKPANQKLNVFRTGARRLRKRHSLLKIYLQTRRET